MHVPLDHEAYTVWKQIFIVNPVMQGVMFHEAKSMLEKIHQLLYHLMGT